MSTSCAVSGEGDCSQLVRCDISHQDLHCTELAIPSQGTGIFALEREDIVGFRAWLRFFVLSPSPNPQFNNVMVWEGVCSLMEDVDEHKL